MNKKISIGLCLALILLTITVTFSVTMLMSKQIYNRIISNISQRSQVYDIIDEVNRLISNYYYGEASDKNTVNSSIAAGYISGLEDGNSSYLAPSDYTDYVKKLNGENEGIGVETLYNYRDKQLVVSHIFEGSSAQKSGLLQGDVITAINGTAVTYLNYKSLVKSFSAGLLAKVTIEYERNGVKGTAESYGGFSIPSIVSVNVSKTGYIRIDGFYKNTADELSQAINKLKEQGLDKFIFDLRNTKDGTIDYAAQAIDVIAPAMSGNIAVARDKSGNVYKNKSFSPESNSVSGSFAVIINSGTQGPAELFACDIRDMCQARVIGTASAGVGTMQDVFALDNGGAVLLTVAMVEPYGGESAVYDKVGIAPDKEISLSGLENEEIAIINITKDNQISAAVGLLAD